MPQYGPSASPVLAMRLAMRALGEPPFAFPYSFPSRTDRAVEARLHPPQDIGAHGFGRIGLVLFQNVGMPYGHGPEVLPRSEERVVGKGWCRTSKFRWAPAH